MARALLDYFVLDALANDVEDFEHILELLNNADIGWRSHHPEPFSRAEVAPALYRTIRDGLVEALALLGDAHELTGLGERVLPTGALEECWFTLTPHGRLVHAAWEPPARVE